MERARFQDLASPTLKTKPTELLYYMLHARFCTFLKTQTPADGGPVNGQDIQA
jgi:hypothetical protein